METLTEFSVQKLSRDYISKMRIKDFLDMLRKQGFIAKYERADIDDNKKYIITFN